MTTYLTGGWYASQAKGSLRTEVLDGAMDAAGVLHRAGVVPEVVQTLALRVRSLMTLVDPQMQSTNGFGDRERDIIGRRLVEQTVDNPTLSGFVSDCLEHVASRPDLMAFYLHLVHVTRMLQLLALARQAAASLPPPTIPLKAAPRKAAAKKKVAKAASKKAAKKKPAKKPAKKTAKRSARRKKR